MFLVIGQLISEKDHHFRGCVLTDMYFYPLNPSLNFADDY